ncbi:MAG: nucleoside hydrolase [Cyclobacteriaceae bacterium]
MTSFLLCSSLFLQAQPRPLIIDADTGNEMDDLYAIVRALLADDFEVKGLSSAHFNNAQLLADSLWHIYPTKNINTVAISQQLNEELLQALDMEEIIHPLGANRMLGYAWGYYEGAPIPSAPAIDFIIKQAEQMPEGEKLPVACLGAVTNVAAALETRPELVSKLKVYMLGAQYDPARGVWNKSEFNIRNDLNAFDRLLNNQELELYVMPASTASVFRFDHQASLHKLSQMDHPVSKILARRWAEVSAGEKWTMWDLALIEAMIHPDMATLEERAAPPENGGRIINVYTSIEPEQMEAAFWNSLKNDLP